MLSFETLETRCLLSAYVVAPTGDDGGPGTLDQPWATLQHAADVMVAGDQVRIRAGDYAGFDETHSGSYQDGAIRFLADPGVTIVSPESFWGVHGISLDGANLIILQGINVTGMPGAGVHVKDGYQDTFTGPASVTFCTYGVWVTGHSFAPGIGGFPGFNQDVEVAYNAADGIRIDATAEGGTGTILDPVVISVDVHDNGGDGIVLIGAPDGYVQQLASHDNAGDGIRLVRSGTELFSCNLSGNGGWAIEILDHSGGTDLEGGMDLRSQAGSVHISSDSLTYFFSDWNIATDRFAIDDCFLSLDQWRDQTGQDTHSVLG